MVWRSIPPSRPALRAEGLSREIISRVQRLRQRGWIGRERPHCARGVGRRRGEAQCAHLSVSTSPTKCWRHRCIVGLDAGSPFHEGTADHPWSARQDGDVDGRSVGIALRKDGT